MTIIETYESCYSDLHYLVYNEKNELLSDNIVAGRGGDGMWYYYQYGKFVNDSTYVLTRVDNEEVGDDEDNIEIVIDSVITTYDFKKDKEFKIINEQKFRFRK